MEDNTAKSDTIRSTMEDSTSLSEKGHIDESRVVHMTPKRIFKNVIVISLVFLLNLMAYGGLLVLQSSLHRVGGMGTTTQSLLYGCNVICSLFLPKLAVQKLGHKHTVSLAITGYIVWMAANGYAVWWTMVPASMLLGVCAGSFWTAGSSYITILGKQFAQMKGQKLEAVQANFFGIFTMIFTSAGLFANVISSTVLRQSPPENYTGPSEEDLALCGINDCPSNNVTSNVNLQKPAANLVWTLVGISIGLAIIGLIISVVFLDAVPAYLLEEKQTNSIKHDLKATCRQLVRPKQLLLIPISSYVGLSSAFKLADWNKSFVTCNLGIRMVGYTTIVFCSANAAMSYISGKLVKVTGWIPVFVFGMCIELGLILTYFFWTPDPTEPVIFFVLPILSGMGDGIWRTQVPAIHGFIFSEDNATAFSVYNVWKALGYFLGFGYSSRLCMTYKLYILVANVVLGVICYWFVDLILRSEKAKAKNSKLEAENMGLNETETITT